jgi:hypothetical protein
MASLAEPRWAGQVGLTVGSDGSVYLGDDVNRLACQPSDQVAETEAPSSSTMRDWAGDPVELFIGYGQLPHGWYVQSYDLTFVVSGFP